MKHAFGKECQMEKMPPEDVGEISVEPMDPGIASFLRKITTFFKLHLSCRFKVCRRAGACATRHVVCYQALEEDLKPIVRSIRARAWRRATERGEKPDVSPASQGDRIRLLAWEDQEIAAIASGAYGGEGDLTPYQLWLRNCAIHDRRPASAAATPASVGQPYDPDARVPP
jgi:hypothetical protein